MNSNIARQKFLSLILFALISETLAGQNAGSAQNIQWKIHDMSRPKPAVVQPLDQLLPAPAPQNAIILFDGSGFSNWVGSDNGNPKWKIEKDYMEIVPGTGAIQTKESFGDVFLHVEWASPDEPDRKGQDRGNSGIFLWGCMNYRSWILTRQILMQTVRLVHYMARRLPGSMYVNPGGNGMPMIFLFAVRDSLPMENC